MAVNSTMYKLSLLLVPPIYSLVSALLFSTCKVREFGRENLDECLRKGPFIGAVWHYSVFYTINRMRGMDWVAMVSASKDAEYISQLLNRMGFKTVRGSRGKGGLLAIREMGLIMGGEGKNAAIIADGSQGPPRKAQAGAILLASKTGAPILPMAWAAKKFMTFRSWDRTVLPLPFTSLVLYYGKPIHVSEHLRSPDIETCRVELENALNEVYASAWGSFDRLDHDGAGSESVD